MIRVLLSLGAGSALMLSACAAPAPAGPSLTAAPGPGKTADQFRGDDARCRTFASSANGGVSPAQGAVQSALGSAAIGTVLGAAAGALIGAAGGAAGAGAAIGAGTGLIAGTAVGGGNAQASGAALQHNYDTAYAQCMASAGERLFTPPYPYATYYPPVVIGSGYYDPYPQYWYHY